MQESIFSPAYWKAACKELKSLKRLIFAALICALSVVVGALYVTVGENLRVYFTFFITAVGCAVYGPVLGVLVAAVTDTLNFFLFPSGPYFPGYMLSEMVGALIYSAFLYRRKITVLRLFGSKFLVNFLVNVLMGSLWSQILFGKGYLFYLLKSLVKNSLLLPLEVMALAALFSLLIPVFSRMNLLPGMRRKSCSGFHSAPAPFRFSASPACWAADAAFITAATLKSSVLVFQILGFVLLAAGALLLLTGLFYNRRQERLIQPGKS